MQSHLIIQNCFEGLYWYVAISHLFYCAYHTTYHKSHTILHTKYYLSLPVSSVARSRTNGSFHSHNPRLSTYLVSWSLEWYHHDTILNLGCQPSHILIGNRDWDLNGWLQTCSDEWGLAPWFALRCIYYSWTSVLYQSPAINTALKPVNVLIGEILRHIIIIWEPSSRAALRLEPTTSRLWNKGSSHWANWSYYCVSSN